VHRAHSILPLAKFASLFSKKRKLFYSFLSNKPSMFKFKPTFRIRLALIIAGTLVVLAITNGVLIAIGADIAINALASFVILAFGLALAAFAYLFTKSVVIQVNDKEISMSYGILNKITVTIPLAKIDNMTEKQNIFESFAGVTDLYIDTPATLDYEMVFNDIGKKDAAQILKLIGAGAAQTEETAKR